MMDGVAELAERVGKNTTSNQPFKNKLKSS